MQKLKFLLIIHLINVLKTSEQVNNDEDLSIDCDKFVEQELHLKVIKPQERYFKRRRLANFYFIGFPSEVTFKDDRHLQICRQKIFRYLKIHDRRFNQIENFINYTKNILQGEEQEFNSDFYQLITCKQKQFLKIFFEELQLNKEQRQKFLSLIVETFKLEKCIETTELQIKDYIEYKKQFPYYNFKKSNYLGDFFGQFNNYEYLFKQVEFSIGKQQIKNYKQQFQFQKTIPRQSLFINIDPSLKSKQKIQYVIKLSNKLVQQKNEKLHESFLNLLFSQYDNQQINFEDVSQKIEFKKLSKRFKSNYSFKNRPKFELYNDQEIEEIKYSQQYIFEQTIIESSQYIPIIYYKKKQEYKDKSMFFKFISKRLKECYFHFLKKKDKIKKLNFIEIIYCARLLNIENFKVLQEIREDRIIPRDKILFELWFLTLKNKYEFFVEWNLNLNQENDINTIIYQALNQVPGKIAQLQKLLMYQNNLQLQMFLNLISLTSYDFENAGFLFQSFFQEKYFESKLQNFGITDQDKIDLYFALAQKIICPVCIYELINLGEYGKKTNKLRIYYINQNCLNYSNLPMIYFVQIKQFLIRQFKNLFNSLF